MFPSACTKQGFRALQSYPFHAYRTQILTFKENHIATTKVTQKVGLAQGIFAS